MCIYILLTTTKQIPCTVYEHIQYVQLIYTIVILLTQRGIHVLLQVCDPVINCDHKYRTQPYKLLNYTNLKYFWRV